MRSTKQNLDNNKFVQLTGNTLNLSGDTTFYNGINLVSSGSTSHNLGVTNDGRLLIDGNELLSPTRESMSWFYNTGTTDQDPGFNNFSLSSDELSGVTWMNFSSIMRGTDVSSYIDDLTSGSTIVGIQIDDENNKLSFIADEGIVVYSNYVHVPVLRIVDYGGSFENNVEVVSNFSFKSEASGGGHIIKQDASGIVTQLPQQSNLIFRTNENGVAINLPTSGATGIDLKFESSLDVDPTGKQAGDIWGVNSNNTKTEAQQTAIMDHYLNSVEANISADGQLSTILLAGYKLDTVRAKEESGVNMGDVSLSSTSGGTEIVNSYSIVANMDDELTLSKKYFSSVNDTELYVNGITGGTMSLYFTQKKV